MGNPGQNPWPALGPSLGNLEKQGHAHAQGAVCALCNSSLIESSDRDRVESLLFSETGHQSFRTGAPPTGTAGEGLPLMVMPGSQAERTVRSLQKGFPPDFMKSRRKETRAVLGAFGSSPFVTSPTSPGTQCQNLGRCTALAGQGGPTELVT